MTNKTIIEFGFLRGNYTASGDNTLLDRHNS